MLKGQRDLRKFLDRKVEEYNRPSFIAGDPISIPHRFSKKQDIEIAGFFAAIFSCGHRTTIIQKAHELMRLMHDSPHQFFLHHSEKDLRGLLDFRLRTFNATDLLYFIELLWHHYTRHDSLEDAFLLPDPETPAYFRPGQGSGPNLVGFYHYFFSLEDAPARTFKHISSPEKNSACKRLNMFLRW